jgi:hypothetical protein
VTGPKRIQLRRTKGWRKPDGAVVVTRATKWGNPYVIHEHSDKCGDELESCPLKEDQWPAANAAHAVRLYRSAYLHPLIGQPWLPSLDGVRWHLRGKDLACFCPLDQPCHADVLLELANGEES